MSFRTVAAGRGVEWVTEGAKRILAKPEVFGVMALIIGVISGVPVLGIVNLIIGPALLGGLFWALREHEAGRPTEVGQLFTAFQQPGKAGPMLTLCLPLVAGGIVAAIIGAVIFGAVIAAAVAGGRAGGGIGVVGGLVGAVIMLAIGIAIAFTTFFAVARTMLDNVAPFDAMKESISACIANVGAVLLYAVLVFLAALILSPVMFIPVLGAMIHGAVMAAISGGALYTAYLDVFGATASAPPSFPPSMGPPPGEPPSAPPPPPM